MSLRAFHIVFIVIAIALCAITGVWGIRSHSQYGEAGDLALGILALVLGLGLIAYGAWFIGKITNEGRS